MTRASAPRRLRRRAVPVAAALTLAASGGSATAAAAAAVAPNRIGRQTDSLVAGSATASSDQVRPAAARAGETAKGAPGAGAEARAGAESRAGGGEAAAPRAAAAAQVRDIVFASPSLGREMRYRVLLPAGYEGSAPRRYPVLYLLHGAWGSHENWESNTDLAGAAEGLDVVVVMPDGGNSWYSNSASDARDRFEDYLTRDLVGQVEERFRVVRSRQGRAIAGLSMGGFGALKAALKYPQLYALAGSFSGALHGARELDAERPDLRERLLAVFGPAGSAARRENDVFQWVEKVKPADLPYLYLDCGTGDAFVAANRDFVSRLHQKKVAYEYHELPGQHDWPYWDRQIRPFLAMAADKLGWRRKR